jgi:hypothetical protein
MFQDKYGNNIEDKYGLEDILVQHYVKVGEVLPLLSTQIDKVIDDKESGIQWINT